MTTNRIFRSAVSATILLLFAAHNLLACACCAEAGTYSIWTAKPDAYLLGVIGDIQFEKTADLYLTDAEFESIKGLDPVAKEYETAGWTGEPGGFDIAATFAAKRWTLKLKTKGGKTGTLILPMPLQVISYKADIHDGRQSGGGGPLLYKEMIFKGRVAGGSGFVKSGLARQANYFLVFQGRGNNCDNASDFKNWRFDITGPNAKYAFYGKLNTAG
ncbi:MAG TPA: hypothetical protein VK468_11675 [Pyrinomonadaceae bacterium]|nr:hypothetical protein [Pyrinomonadaceae bacterium]